MLEFKNNDLTIILNYNIILLIDIQMISLDTTILYTSYH